MAQLKARRVKKTYLALVQGAMPAENGRIEAPIGRDPRHYSRMAVIADGTPAMTGYRVRERFRAGRCSRSTCTTGRTHQIRVHLASIGHPVAGDPIYATRRGADAARTGWSGCSCTRGGSSSRRRRGDASDPGRGATAAGARGASSTACASAAPMSAVTRKPNVSILISGPSRTGKTTAANILAERYGIDEHQDRRGVPQAHRHRHLELRVARDRSLDQEMDDFQATKIRAATAGRAVHPRGAPGGVPGQPGAAKGRPADRHGALLGARGSAHGAPAAQGAARRPELDADARGAARRRARARGARSGAVEGGPSGARRQERLRSRPDRRVGHARCTTWSSTRASACPTRSPTSCTTGSSSEGRSAADDVASLVPGRSSRSLSTRQGRAAARPSPTRCPRRWETSSPARRCSSSTGGDARSASSWPRRDGAARPRDQADPRAGSLRRTAPAAAPGRAGPAHREHYLAPPALVVRAMLAPGMLERVERVTRQRRRRRRRDRVGSHGRPRRARSSSGASG